MKKLSETAAPKRVLGRVSSATQGGVYGAIETSGLRNTAIEL
ncbi:MAG TPA: hypothetical protein VGD23_13600 [Sphingomicrobium sp.]